MNRLGNHSYNDRNTHPNSNASGISNRKARAVNTNSRAAASGRAARSGKSNLTGFRLSLAFLILIAMASLLAPLLAPYGVNEMTAAVNEAPSILHWFGTDSLGRDLWGRVLYGGRASLVIGWMAAALSAALAVLYGTLSGLAGPRMDQALMRACDLLLSVPQILMAVFLQAILGAASWGSLVIVIGATGWMGLARIVRNEVRKLRGSDYITAAQMMGASSGYILRTHLLPNFIPAILYPMISSIGSAIASESTLSFLGLGLPLDSASWGSLLSDAQRSLLSGQWWTVIFPGSVLVLTLIAIAEVGEHFRLRNTRRHSNL